VTAFADVARPFASWLSPIGNRERRNRLRGGEYEVKPLTGYAQKTAGTWDPNGGRYAFDWSAFVRDELHNTLLDAVWVIRVGWGWYAFGGIADMNS
jgi:hypothetical protein